MGRYWHRRGARRCHQSQTEVRWITPDKPYSQSPSDKAHRRGTRFGPWAVWLVAGLLVVGALLVLGRAGDWGGFVPPWMFVVGCWTMV
ncbi:MAG: DUF3995 domain-containing protein, partial [Acidimicrobiia bacterium]|nr:DUF3995 domain-containing protein [Acidimicrobiia bacterium]